MISVSEELEVLLELAWLEHIGFRQKPEKNQTLKPLKPKNRVILVNFGPRVTCWLSKSIYLSWGIQGWPRISHFNGTKT